MQKQWLEHIKTSRNKIDMVCNNLQEVVSFSDLDPMTHDELLNTISICDNLVTRLNAIIVKEMTLA